MEREGYDVSYLTNIDVHANANLLLQHRAFIVAGHDEYWTYQMRAGVQAARANGVHLGFFSGNQTYWQARLEPSPRTGDANRTLVGYKDNAQAEDPYALDGDRSNASHWVFANTGVVNGTRFTGLLGYETDAAFNNGFQPPGLEIVGASPDPIGVSNMATYTAPSGAVVFATGTIQWAWGVDDFGGRGFVNPAAQQVTRNVLARFAAHGAATPKVRQ